MPANAFAAAAAKASSPAASGKKKDQNIVLLDAEENPDVIVAIDDFVEADAREKQAKSDKELHKGIAKPHCLETFLAAFAAKGKQPSTTKFRTPTVIDPEDPEGKKVLSGGNTVTFVVQDRGELYKASPEQVETLTALLGEDKTAEIITEVTTFAFDPDILEKPGVMDKLGHAISELVTSGTISEADGGNLLVANSRTSVRKGVVEDLAQLCDKDADLMGQVLAALGSHSTQFIKA
jgi:hypothetical protein